jgi:hypothetical protein
MKATIKSNWIIISGDKGNEQGTIEAVGRKTDRAIKMRLKRERCNGDRWARAFYRLGVDTTGIEIGTGEARSFDQWRDC